MKPKVIIPESELPEVLRGLLILEKSFMEEGKKLNEKVFENNICLNKVRKAIRECSQPKTLNN